MTGHGGERRALECKSRWSSIPCKHVPGVGKQGTAAERGIDIIITMSRMRRLGILFVLWGCVEEAQGRIVKLNCIGKVHSTPSEDD